MDADLEGSMASPKTKDWLARLMKVEVTYDPAGPMGDQWMVETETATEVVVNTDEEQGRQVLIHALRQYADRLEARGIQKATEGGDDGQ